MKSTLSSWSTRFVAASLSFFFSFALPLARAQVPTLVADLNQTVVPNEPGDPQVLGDAGVHTILSAKTAEYGIAVYRSVLGATKPILLRHFKNEPMVRPLSIERVGELGGALLFFVDDVLFRTDGTPAGTSRIFAFEYQQIFAVSRSVVVGSRRIVVGSVEGREFVFATDGSATGTVLLPPSEIVEAASIGTLAFLVARKGEVWRSDGTLGGTYRMTFNPALYGVRNVTALQGRFHFQAHDWTGDGALWTSDGTAAGTRVLKDFDGTVPVQWFETRVGKVFGSRRIFGVLEGQRGKLGLWQTDGTTTGTTRIVATNGVPKPLAIVGNRILYSDLGWLWSTDGTTKIALQSTIESPNDVVSIPRGLIFTTPRAGGNEVWLSDGTVAGTQRLRDIRLGPNGSNPGRYARTQAGTVLFAADDGTLGYELWTTDGTPGRTQLLHDFRAARVKNRGTDFARLERMEWGSYVQSLERGVTKLFATDGTARGTRLLRSFPTPGLRPVLLAPLGAQTFVGGDLGTGLVRTDGTPAGTIPLDPQFVVASLETLGGSVYYSGQRTGGAFELWRLEGAKRTRLFMNASKALQGLAPAGRRLVFKSGVDLYRTDGTVVGTQRIDPSLSPDVWSGPWPPVSVDSKAYFTARDGSNRLMLMVSDGTSAGTRAVRDPSGGTLEASFRSREWAVLERSGRRVLFFSAFQDATGLELWRTDGTPQGTRLVRDIRPGPELGLDANEIHVFQNRLYFYADDGVRGLELWSSDGTAAGTALVREIYPGSRGCVVRGNRGRMCPAGAWLYFTADDGVHGTELWRTDGTAAGTTLVHDLNRGDLGSHPEMLRVADGGLLFTADDGVLGRELWKLDPGAHPQILGSGCGARRAPQLRATLPKQNANLVLTTRTMNASVGAGVLVLSAPATRPWHAANGCVLFVDFTNLAVALPFRLASGVGSVRTFVPNHAALQGVVIRAQSAVGPTATAPFGLDLSNGLGLVIGR